MGEFGRQPPRGMQLPLAGREFRRLLQGFPLACGKHLGPVTTKREQPKHRVLNQQLAQFNVLLRSPAMVEGLAGNADDRFV